MNARPFPFPVRYHAPMHPSRGMSLVDVIVGSALVLIVFVALLGLLRTSLLISSSSKAKAGATTVASTQMEYIRSLPYDTVGTVGGIPAGPVAQYATTTLNGIPYVTRTLVQYVDDAKDGSGSGDTNGITTDYKRVRVATSYIFRGEEREVAMISNVVPPSIETTVGGGTLRVQVVSAAGAAVSGASVRVYNPNLSPTVDVTAFTDISGAIAFPGAPLSANYRITVTKDGYSTAETYARDSTNQNPTPGYLTVARNQTTTGTFAIDVLSPVAVATFFPEQATSTQDLFNSTARVTEMVNVAHTGTAFTLAGGTTAGSFRGLPVAPSYLVRWTSAAFATSLPAGTSVLVRVLDASGALLPDSVLPGNSSGFSASPISLTGVSTTTYPSLVLSASLASAATTSAPTVLDWTASSVVGPIPAPNVPFTLTGAKRKGTTGAGAPIYKTVIATTSDQTGVRNLSLEWDIYNLVIGTGYALVTSTPAAPFTIEPGTGSSVQLIVQ